MNMKTKYTYADGVKPDFTAQPCCSLCTKKLRPNYDSKTIGYTLDDGSFVETDGRDVGRFYDTATQKNRAATEHVERQAFLGWGHRPWNERDRFCSMKCGYKFGYNCDVYYGTHK